MTRTYVAGKKRLTLLFSRTALALALLFPVGLCAESASALGTKPANRSAAQSAAQPAAKAGTANPSAGVLSGETGKQAQAYYHFALGHLEEQSAVRYGRPDLAAKAIEQYKQAIADDPSSAFLLNSLAKTYFNLGRVREAMQTAKHVLKSHPDNLPAHKLLGRIYLRSLGDSPSGQPSSEMLNLAIAEFQKIVALDPGKIESHLLLGQLYEMKQDGAGARKQFEKARQINPGSAHAALALAQLYGAQGDYSKAARALKDIPDGQRTPKTGIMLGALYDRMKKTDLAIAAYQAALNLQPDNLNAQRALAEDLLLDGKEDAARKIFQGIATQDPKDIHSLLRLAELERMQGHLDKAQSALKKAQSLDPDSTEVRYNQAMLAVSKGRLDQAAALLQQLAASTAHKNGQYTAGEKANRGVFLYQLARVYRDQNKTSKAIGVYKQMIALGGENAERGYRGQVQTYRDAKMLSQAMDAARQGVKALPKSVEMKLTLASQLVDAGKTKQGIALARAQLNGSKQDRVVWLSLAQLYTRARKWKEAGAAIDQVAKRSHSKQDKALVHFLRGALAERQKHIGPAVRELERSLALDPDNALTLNYLGYTLADHNLKLNKALHLIQHAVRLDPENGAYLDSLGWVHYKLGQYAQAEKALKRAVALMPADPTVRDHLGQVYSSTGHLRKAVAQWQNSLKNYARSAPADASPSDVKKVRQRLDKAKQQLARQESSAQRPKTSGARQGADPSVTH